MSVAAIQVQSREVKPQTTRDVALLAIEHPFWLSSTKAEQQTWHFLKSDWEVNDVRERQVHPQLSYVVCTWQRGWGDRKRME